MSILKAEKIKKKFGIRRILSDVNLQLERGEIFVLFGPNGSGKSTFSLILSSLLKPTGGCIKFENNDIRKLNSSYRSKIGLLTHSSFLYENLSALENLRFYAALYGLRDIKRRIDEFSHLFEIETRMNEPVKNFSRGMKQRLSIIRALIHNPEIILFDEPYTGLDELSAQILERELLNFRKSGKLIFITTHNLLRGYNIATRLGILSRGRILFESEKKNITADELSETYKRLIQNETL
ncbi:MAG: ABC transporter ATP-binding protein [Candidatus Cloacimonadota bacterium]|nr:MAG: ABC transporter ATP-binding protein [Candidatus Cloacimonadota bacterium]